MDLGRPSLVEKKHPPRTEPGTEAKAQPSTEGAGTARPPSDLQRTSQKEPGPNAASAGTFLSSSPA